MGSGLGQTVDDCSVDLCGCTGVMIEAVFMVCLTLILLLGPYVPPRF